MPTATATRVIDRLEAAGFLRRERDTTDRRRVILQPDRAKIAIVDAAFEGTAARLNGLREHFSQRQLDAFMRLLRMATEELRAATAEMRDAR